MKSLAKGIALCILFFIPIISQAGWPVISVPLPQQIISKMTTVGCLPGYARIPADTEFPFSVFQQTWYWTFQGSDSCRKIPRYPNDINYVTYQQAGYYTGSTISVGYGQTEQDVLFRFEFKIPSCSADGMCHWFCGPTTPDKLPRNVSCAYDELKRPK